MCLDLWFGLDLAEFLVFDGPGSEQAGRRASDVPVLVGDLDVSLTTGANALAHRLVVRLGSY